MNPGGNVYIMDEWKEFREELLQDPEVREAYDARAVERALACAVMQQRLDQKVTQKDMAGKMRVPQGNVSRLESGVLSPTIATLQKAAQALNVPLEIRFGEQIISVNK